MRPTYKQAVFMALFMFFTAVVYSITIHFKIIVPSGLEYAEEVCFWLHLPSIVLIIYACLMVLFYRSSKYVIHQTTTN